MNPFLRLAVIALAFATPAAGQSAPDEEEPTAEELAQFELLRQRSLEEKGISLSAAGIVPVPVAGSPVVPSRPQQSWEERERERAIAFDAQFGEGAYAGIAGFSKRCKFADGCNRFAAVDLIKGAYQFVDLQKDVEENVIAPDSGAYRGRHQEIKGGIRAAMEDFRPGPDASPAYEKEFIKASEPIVKKIFTKDELLRYAERNAASSDSAAFYTYLGQTLNGAGPPGKARDAFDAALRREPANDEALSGRAEARLNMGDYPGAVRDAVAALKLNPRNARAYAALKFSEGRAAGSGSAGAFAAAGGGSSPVPGGGAGAAESFSGGAGAPVSFDASRRSDALVADARRRLSLGDPSAAVGLLGKAVELNPRSAEALTLTAIALIRTKDYAGALAAAEAGLKLAPNNVPLLDAKANALNYLKDYRGALAAADLAISANPNDAMAHYNRAWALGGLEDREGAIASLRSAARLNPQFAPALASALELPREDDFLYLFSGEGREARPEPAASAPASGRRSWLLMGGGAAGIIAALMLGARRKRSAAPPPLSSVLKVPKILDGKFEVGREIGSGGMGVVYEGRDLSLDRAVAVKRMREEIRWDPRERARFVAEAKLVAKLKHPHIVEIRTIVEQEGEVYLIFEYIAGRTLHQVIAEDGKLPFQRARDLFRGAAAALDYAHGLSVIHRDLKPANLMVDAEGRVRVMDFGIARLTEDALSRRTGTNSAVGTPLYMAPEQEQGVARRESDAYSMAVCLYEALTGRRPFAGSGAGLLMNKLKSVYEPPSKIDPRLPAGLDEIFAKALDPDPDKRYPSAGNLLRALESLEATRY